MTIGQILNITGLALDMFGVIILFRYGIPPEVNPHGYSFELREGIDEPEKAKWLKYKRWSNIGLFIIIIGFAFQFIGAISNNFISEPTHCKYKTDCKY